jgi:hypothetical protein
MTATRTLQREIRAQLHTKLEVARTEYESSFERNAFEKYWRAHNSFTRFILYGHLLYGHLAEKPHSK